LTIVILAGLGGVLLGLFRGGLPGASLQFRWNYWEVTSRIIAQHPWTGVGALNFDHAYMALKPIQYPEEIQDPHNFVMSILSQWGIFGGIGLFVSLIGASTMMARTWGPLREQEHLEILPDDIVRRISPLWMASLAVGFLILRFWMMYDYWISGSSGQAMVFFDLGLYGLIWTVSFIAAAWLPKDVSRQSFGNCQIACLCGVIAFLLHNTIDYSIFYPGTLIPFMAVAAVLMARGQAQVTYRKEAARTLLIFGGAVIGLLLLLSMTVVPVTASNLNLIKARTLASQSPPNPERIIDRYHSAARADLTDPIPLAESAAWQIEFAQYLISKDLEKSRNKVLGLLSGAYEDVEAAIRRDPCQISLYRLRAYSLTLKHQITHSQEDLWEAIKSARKVLELYPASPDGHLFLAEQLAYAATQLNSADLKSEAVMHYQQALELDAARPGMEEVRRWSPERRRFIQNRLDMMKSFRIETPSTASAPFSENE